MQPIARIQEALFWSRVDRSDGPDECWPWTGKRDRYGYGEYEQKLDGLRCYWRAHRVVYELLVGPIPDGLVIDHLCRVRHCVNPAHLDLVTNAENIRRGDTGKHLRTTDACRNGHARTEQNTTQSGGRLICRTCNKLRMRRFLDRQAGASSSF